MISRMTQVKYSGVKSPTESPFWETIRATSPLVIIPIPIFRESDREKRQTLAISPQPMIFANNATSTKKTEKSRISASTLSREVFKPMLAKKTGPNSM